MNKPKCLLYSGLVLLSALIAPHSLRAQEPAAETLQQNGLSNPDANPLPAEPESNADLGQLDFVQKYPKPDRFTFSSTQQFFYTDNVFFTNSNPVASTAYLGSYTGSFVPYSTRTWIPRVSFQYNMVRYGSVASGDFDNENLAFSSPYAFGKDDSWTWTPSATLSRFTAPHSNDHEFYKEALFDSQITHTQQLSKTVPLFFTAGYDLSYHLADPDQFDRLDNTLSFNLIYYPIPELSIGAYVRPSARIFLNNVKESTSAEDYYYYPAVRVTNVYLDQHDRDDFNLSEGIDVTWHFSKYASLSADFTNTDDYSNNAQFSYSQTSPGVSLTGTIGF